MSRAFAVGWTGIAVLLLTACPHESNNERDVRLSIKLSHQGVSPLEPDPQILTLGAADAEALDVRNPVIRDDFGGFIIFTSIEATGDEKYEHCLEDPIVVTDADTGAVDLTISSGTCLTEGTTLRRDWR